MPYPNADSPQHKVESGADCTVIYAGYVCYTSPRTSSQQFCETIAATNSLTYYEQAWVSDLWL